MATNLTDSGQLTTVTNTTFIQNATFTLDPSGLDLCGNNYYTLPGYILGNTWTIALQYTPIAHDEQSQIFSQQFNGGNDIQCSIGYFTADPGSTTNAGAGYYAGLFLHTNLIWYTIGPLGISDGQGPYNIAVTLDTSRMLRCYVDGSQAGSVQIPSVSSSNEDLLIGSNWDKTKAVTGTLHSLQIFPFELSQPEIAYLASGTLSSHAIQDPSANGLRFELDASANLNDLIDISSSTPNYAAVPQGSNVLVLDGNTVYTTKNDISSNGSWTMAMRYMELAPPPVNSYSQIIHQTTDDTLDQVVSIGKYGGYTSNTEPEYVVFMGGQGGSWTFGPTFTLNQNGWTDIVVTSNGTTLTLYVDGVLVGTPMSSPNLVSSQPFVIGKEGWVSGGQPLINGAIAQLLIYNRHMSASEAYYLHSGETLPLLEITDVPQTAFVLNIANEMMKIPESAIATAITAVTAAAPPNNENSTMKVMTAILLATTKADSISAKSIAEELKTNQTLSGSQTAIFSPYNGVFYDAIGIYAGQQNPPPLVAIAPDASGNLNTAGITGGTTLSFPIKTEGIYTLDTGDTITIDANDNQYFNGTGSPLAQGDSVTLSNGKIFRITFLDPVWGEVGFHVDSPSSGDLDVSSNSGSTQVDISGYSSGAAGTYVVTASNIPAGAILSSWTVDVNGSSSDVPNTDNTLTYTYTDTTSYVKVTVNYLIGVLTVIGPRSTSGTIRVDGNLLDSEQSYNYSEERSYTLVATPAEGLLFKFWFINGVQDLNYTDSTIDFAFTNNGNEVTILAVFGPPPGTLTITYPDPADGTITRNGTPVTQDISYNTVSNHELAATAAQGKVFVNWQITDLNDSTQNFTVSDNPYTYPYNATPTITFTAVFSGGGGGGGGGGAICFLKDAPVLTPTGYKRISSLKVGDLVQTPEGNAVPIQSVKVQHTRPSQAVNPYVIPKGRFGATKELFISPEHKVQVNGAMTEAKSLGLKQHKMSEPFDYYNLELPNYEKMIVAGVTVESMFPITRVKISMEQFKHILVTKYGNATPEVLARILRNIRILPDGCVEVPADRRAVQRASM
jgi:hypothetical protein